GFREGLGRGPARAPGRAGHRGDRDLPRFRQEPHDSGERLQDAAAVGRGPRGAAYRPGPGAERGADRLPLPALLAGLADRHAAALEHRLAAAPPAGEELTPTATKEFGLGRAARAGVKRGLLHDTVSKAAHDSR